MNIILRAPWHDYTQRCIYLVTLNKSPLVENFGSLEGDCHLSAGTKGSSFIRASAVGSAIKKVLKDFSQSSRHTLPPNLHRHERSRGKHLREFIVAAAFCR